jgi:hypothetical protein
MKIKFLYKFKLIRLEISGQVNRRIGDLELQNSIKEILTKLRSSKAQVFLFGKTADFVKDPYDRLALDLKRENFYFSVLGYSSSDRILARAAGGLGVFYFSPAPHMCKEHVRIFKDKDEYLFFDSGHLSCYGSKQIIKKNFEQFHF